MDSLTEIRERLIIKEAMLIIRTTFQTYLEVYKECNVTVSAKTILSVFEAFVNVCSKAKEIGNDDWKETAKEIYELYEKLKAIVPELNQ